MTEIKYFLGVDGGGSKTTAVVFNSIGEFICRACGESINYYSIGIEKARENMRDIMNRLVQKQFAFAVIGMSALNSRADAAETQRFCEGIIDSDSIIMDSDLYIALKALDAQGECAVVISGTGSMAVYQNSNGEISHAGGWGYILGDEGSGYSIGLSAIKAAVRAAENAAPTALLDECIKYFAINNIYELIDLYYDKTVSRKITAAFSETVARCAENGDEVAKKIIKTEAGELFQTAFRLIKNAKKDIPIGLWGGVFQHNRIFSSEFTELMNNCGFSDVKLLNFTPEIGAIFACIDNYAPESLENIKEAIKADFSLSNM